jgi:DNA-binding NtrC family response regulator
MADNILFIEDDPSFLDALTMKLTAAGYKVHGVVNAEDALTWLQDHEAYVIITDITLPGMNGIELCQQVKQEDPLPVFFAITGYSSIFELTDCREAGFEDYFIKPVDSEALLEAVRRAFAKLKRWGLP